MHLIELHKLEATAGAVLQRYRELTAQADASAADSPAALAKAKFEKDWETDAALLTREVEAEATAAKGKRS
jgi:hypothetical protein